MPVIYKNLKGSRKKKKKKSCEPFKYVSMREVKAGIQHAIKNPFTFCESFRIKCDGFPIWF